MFLPLSDAPNPRGVPWVTYTLIVLNVVIFLGVNLPLSRQPASRSDPAFREYLGMVRERLPAGVRMEQVARTVSAFDLVVFKHGFRPGAPEWRDLLTSIFLHAGFMHLAGNMLFLWIYGDNVEYRLGRFMYLFWYLFTGVMATIFFALFAPGSQVPLIGASGAISGVLGFYFLWFPHNVVRVFVFLFPFFMNVVAIPARLVLGIYLVIDNLFPFLFSRSGGGGVAHGAHIGGFVAGLAIAALFRQREMSEKPREYRQPPRLRREPGPILDAVVVDGVREAMARGDYEAAARAYFNGDDVGGRRRLTPEESLRLADWLGANGHGEAALTLYRRQVRDYPRGPGLAEAHLGAGLILLEARGAVAPAYQHLLDALDADPSPEVAARARLALEEIQRRQKFRVR